MSLTRNASQTPGAVQLGGPNHGVKFRVSLVTFLFLLLLRIYLLRIHHLLHAHTFLSLIILPQLINIHRERQSLNLRIQLATILSQSSPSISLLLLPARGRKYSHPSNKNSARSPPLPRHSHPSPSHFPDSQKTSLHTQMPQIRRLQTLRFHHLHNTVHRLLSV